MLFEMVTAERFHIVVVKRIFCPSDLSPRF